MPYVVEFVELLAQLTALLGLLCLALGAVTPVRVVDRRVLEQGGEDEDEAHDEVDVDRLDVGDARQRGAHARADRRHRENRRDPCQTMRHIDEGFRGERSNLPKY